MLVRERSYLFVVKSASSLGKRRLVLLTGKEAISPPLAVFHSLVSVKRASQSIGEATGCTAGTPRALDVNLGETDKTCDVFMASVLGTSGRHDVLVLQPEELLTSRVYGVSCVWTFHHRSKTSCLGSSAAGFLRNDNPKSPWE